mmetsp:Transcript_29871/g.68530  ORF Transcript_29871/g.68530 Transcript_29871/m.68530 type:complete len:497 (-) Transcript_29871:430-1920(-)
MKTLFLRLSLLLFLVTLCSICFAEQDDAADGIRTRWQNLSPTSAMPRGAHVQIDMTTGKRRILVHVEDGSPVMVQDEKETGTTTTEMATIEDATSARIKDEEGAGSTDPSFPSSDKVDYDYGMMYGVLSKLPAEEKERMGLPSVPSPDDLSEGASDVFFQSKMRAIWEARQKEVRKIMEENVLNFPDVLKELIAILQNSTDAKNDTVDMDMETVSDALEELEYHLSDIDMARDFHTLKGWSLLVEHALREEERFNVPALRAIGSAVRNIGEFRPYATEMVVMGGGAKTHAVRATLDAATREDVPRATREAAIGALGALVTHNDLGMRELLQAGGHTMLERIYVEHAKRARAAVDLRSSNDGYDDAAFKKDLKISIKLVSLAQDVVKMGQDCIAKAHKEFQEKEEEVELTISGETNVDEHQLLQARVASLQRQDYCNDIVTSFATPGWCNNFIIGPYRHTDKGSNMFHVPVAQQEKVLGAILNLGGACREKKYCMGQ